MKVGEVQECQMCRARKDDAYWRHIEPSEVHFFAKVLTHAFHQSLAIPMNYVRNLFVKLPTRVSLKVASERTWAVGVRERDNSLVFERGWSEFVKDNSLKENDVLVFRYHDYGEVCIQVLLFDQTGYEKDKIQPVKECEISRDSTSDCIKNTPKKENLMEAKKPKPEPVEFHNELQQNTPTPSQKGRKYKSAGKDRVTVPELLKVESLPNLHKVFLEPVEFHAELQQNTPTPSQKEREHKRAGKARVTEPDLMEVESLPNLHKKIKRCDGLPAKRQRRGNSEEDYHYNPLPSSVRDDNGQGHLKISQQRQSTNYASSKSEKRVPEREENIKEEPDDSDYIGPSIDLSLTYKMFYKSQRRAVTKKEMDEAFQSAKAIISFKPNFISVMRPTNVYKRFFVTIPQELLREHIPRKTKAAILRVPLCSKTWTVRLVIREYSAGLDVGWADFVMDNNLEEGDVCLFELCGVQKCGRFLIDASIHRVVQEVVPLIRVKRPPSTKGKNSMK